MSKCMAVLRMMSLVLLGDCLRFFTLIWILLRGMINRILEFKLKGSVLMVEVRGLILPMMVTPTLIDLPRRVRV